MQISNLIKRSPKSTLLLSCNFPVEKETKRESDTDTETEIEADRKRGRGLGPPGQSKCKRVKLQFEQWSNLA